tara:strand:- start:6310 stop:6819 length:510 start_codon:yes stop_codon:yes gene_type:complete
MTDLTWSDSEVGLSGFFNNEKDNEYYDGTVKIYIYQFESTINFVISSLNIVLALFYKNAILRIITGFSSGYYIIISAWFYKKRINILQKLSQSKNTTDNYLIQQLKNNSIHLYIIFIHLLYSIKIHSIIFLISNISGICYSYIYIKNMNISDIVKNIKNKLNNVIKKLN